MNKTLYKHIAMKVSAIRSCQEMNNHEWAMKHNDALTSICDSYLPSGSGIDSGTRFNLVNSTPDKLVFTFEYHHMRDGYYTKWTSHTVTVKPSLINDIEVDITKDGCDYSTMDYLHEVFYTAMTMEVEA